MALISFIKWYVCNTAGITHLKCTPYDLSEAWTIFFTPRTQLVSIYPCARIICMLFAYAARKTNYMQSCRSHIERNIVHALLKSKKKTQIWIFSNFCEFFGFEFLWTIANSGQNCKLMWTLENSFNSNFWEFWRILVISYRFPANYCKFLRIYQKNVWIFLSLKSYGVRLRYDLMWWCMRTCTIEMRIFRKCEFHTQIW